MKRKFGFWNGKEPLEEGDFVWLRPVYGLFFVFALIGAIWSLVLVFVSEEQWTNFFLFLGSAGLAVEFGRKLRELGRVS